MCKITECKMWTSYWSGICRNMGWDVYVGLVALCARLVVGQLLVCRYENVLTGPVTSS